MNTDARETSAVLALGRAARSGTEERTRVLFNRRYHAMNSGYDKLLTRLMLVQWVLAIVFAAWLSPLTWAGKQSAVHAHVFAAIVIGGTICSLPILLALKYPGEQVTRYAVAVGQVLWSALLIHLTGGRIETHFHVFASLAILSFYRDVKVLIPATIAVAADHFIRGIYWPESVYGVVNPEWWRFLEHAGWITFLDIFLIYHCVNLKRELWGICKQQVELEDAQEAVARNEKLAAVGQLAAGVGHELRNPLAAVRNAAAFVDKKLHKQGNLDPKVERFLGIIERELEASNKIISNLLDFSRPKQPTPSPTPLRPLVDEVLSVVPKRDHVEMINRVPDDLPVPDLDKDQFRQVLMNLAQNGAEAVPEDRPGKVIISGAALEDGHIRLDVEDNGSGMSPDVIERVFQPLYSTKVKGTGLGLAVAASIVERHGGSLNVESRLGEGSRFSILITPARSSEAA